MAKKKALRIGFDMDVGLWCLYVPEDFPTPFCSSCLVDIDKDKIFYFCRTTQNFYCDKCMFKIDKLGRLKVKCPTTEKEHVDTCISRVIKEEVKNVP